ncbi:MAG: hypothetical protein U0Z53_29620 [Blastocatellia bacterium]
MLARWQAFADGYQGFVPVGARYLGNGVLSFGSDGLGRRAPGSPQDTDLAGLNGATGEEAEPGLREIGIGWDGPSAPVEFWAGIRNRTDKKAGQSKSFEALPSLQDKKSG